MAKNKMWRIGELPERIDYSNWINEIEKSNSKYKQLFSNATPFPPVFFFGDPDGAIAATVGVNPSAEEFSSYRRWPSCNNPQAVIKRCRDYFCDPQGLAAHPWFLPWKRFLGTIGLSYNAVPRAVHIDLSPRATRSMGALQTGGKQIQDLFLDLVANDLKYFFGQLKAYPRIRYVYMAGSITKKFYLIEFLKKYSAPHGVTFESVLPFRRGGAGKIGLYNFDFGDDNLHRLFFCSTSPSARGSPDILPQKAAWLKKNYPLFTPRNDFN